MNPVRTALIGAVVSGIASVPAQAGALRFTVEAPGIVSTQIASGTPIVNTFDIGPTGSFAALDTPVGRYTAISGSGSVMAADVWGGSGGTGQYLSVDNGEVMLDFTAAGPGEAVGYLGFWWSSVNYNNDLVVNLVDGSSYTFASASVFGSPSLQTTGGGTGLGHYGNPFNWPNWNNTAEPYAFVNIYAQDASSKIASVAFNGLGFESDNHTIVVALVDSVPVPPTALLLAAGLGLVGRARRRVLR